MAEQTTIDPRAIELAVTVPPMVEFDQEYDSLIAKFEDALQESQEVRLLDFCLPASHPRRVEHLCELICVDIEMGSHCHVDDIDYYRTHHPEVFSHPELIETITRTMLRAQRAAEDEVEFEEQQTPVAALSRTPGNASEKTPSVPANDNRVDPPVIEIKIAEPKTLERARIAQRTLAVISDMKDQESAEVNRFLQAVDSLPGVGELFHGFRLICVLGEGSFARVFLAQQGDLANRLVAIKVSTDISTECETLAQLQHSNIVPIFSVHQVGDMKAICMPYLGRTTLADVSAEYSGTRRNQGLVGSVIDRLRSQQLSSIKQALVSLPDDDRSSSASIEETLEFRCRHRTSNFRYLSTCGHIDSVTWMATRLADGLAHAHERGILHLDIKPSNILVTDDGEPMLLDFNLSRKLDRSQALISSVGGTLPYMSLEQLEAFAGLKTPVDARADIFSLGVVLFELLTGKLPFANYTAVSLPMIVYLMGKDRRSHCPSIHKLEPKVPHGLCAIIEKCLHSDPAKRYQSARDLHTDLVLHTESKPLKFATERSWLERLAKFRRRHPLVTSNLAIGLISACMIVSLAQIAATQLKVSRVLTGRKNLAELSLVMDDVKFLLNRRTAANTADQGLQRAQVGLDRFAIESDRDWVLSPYIQALSSSEQNHLHHQLAELLLLKAHGLCLVSEQRPDEKMTSLSAAKRACELATEVDPDTANSTAYLLQRSAIAQHEGNTEEANDWFKKASDLTAETPRDLYLMAFRDASVGRFRRAIDSLDRLLDQDPTDYHAHFLTGVCSEQVGDLNRAAGSFTNCISLRPSFAPAYFNRGLIRLKLNLPKIAIADFTKAITLDANLSDAYLYRAAGYEAVEEYKSALEDYMAAITAGSAPDVAYLSRSQILTKLGEHERAKTEQARGLEYEPTTEQGWVARGRRRMSSQPKEAIGDFDRALKINPRSFMALQNKAHVLSRYLKDSPAALAVLSQAIANYPEDWRPRAGRGVIHARLKHWDEALEDAKFAARLDNSPPACYQIAGIYATLTVNPGYSSDESQAYRRKAFDLLYQSLAKGFGFDLIAEDAELDPIRSDPEFVKLVDAARTFGQGLKNMRAAR